LSGLEKTIICFDYGDKRTGIAVAYKGTSVAVPVGTVETKDLVDRDYLNRLIKEKKAGLIIVGDPVSLRSEETESTRKAREFAEKVKVLSGLDVVMFDERLTTRLSERGVGRAKDKVRFRPKDIDSASAVIILQGYIDLIMREK